MKHSNDIWKFLYNICVNIVIDYILYFSDACAIELDDKVIVTGGRDTLTRVEVYNIHGWIMGLPDLQTGRCGHGCGHYINADEKIVKKLNQLSLLSIFTYLGVSRHWGMGWW